MKHVQKIIVNALFEDFVKNIVFAIKNCVNSIKKDVNVKVIV